MYSVLWRASDEALSSAGRGGELNRVWWVSRRVRRWFRVIGRYSDGLGLGYQVVFVARKPVPWGS
jgi:hypothetical protein